MSLRSAEALQQLAEMIDPGTLLTIEPIAKGWTGGEKYYRVSLINHASGRILASAEGHGLVKAIERAFAQQSGR